MTFRLTHLFSSPQPRLDSFSTAAASTPSPITQQAVSIFRSTEADIKDIVTDRLEELKSNRRWSCGQLTRRNMRSAVGRIYASLVHTFNHVGNQLLANSGRISQGARRVYSINGVLPFYAAKIHELMRKESIRIAISSAVQISLDIFLIFIDVALARGNIKIISNSDFISRYRFSLYYVGNYLGTVICTAGEKHRWCGFGSRKTFMKGFGLAALLWIGSQPWNAVNVRDAILCIELGIVIPIIFGATNISDTGLVLHDRRTDLGSSTIIAGALPPAIVQMRSHAHMVVAIFAMKVIIFTGNEYFHAVRQDLLTLKEYEIETKERLRERIVRATLFKEPQVHVGLILEFLNYSSQQQRIDAAMAMLIEH